MAMKQNASTGELVEDKSEAPKDAAKKDADKKADDKTLHVKVWSPFRVYFDDQASSISGVNDTGTFDILPRHHNFISLLNPCELMLQTVDGLTKIKISGGVMHVHKNAVTVFLEV